MSGEAIDALAKRLEDDRELFSCIMAGYTKPMEKMLSVNPGLRDRIAFHLEFPDYTEEELLQVFDLMCDRAVFHVTEAGRQHLCEHLERLVARRGEDFANARAVRKIAGHLQMRATRTGSATIGVDVVESVFADGDIARMGSGGAARQVGF